MKQVVTASVTIPSGAWRGVYRQDGSEHDVCDFTLTFTPPPPGGDVGAVLGQGTDFVGEYAISGKYHGQRVAFQKKYPELGHFRDVEGIVG